MPKRFNRNFIILFLIIALGCFFRIWGLSKAGGLWFDELLTWDFAKEAFPLGIFNRLMYEDFHFPLFYFMAHFWIRVFGDGDLVLKVLPCLLGILTIPVSYLAGKELDGEKTGLLVSLLVAMNSFLIFFSQEFRFYSMLSLLSFLSLYFLLKFSNSGSRKSLVGLVLTNIAILYTNTIGFVFVLFEFFFFIIYFALKNKEKLKAFIVTFLLTGILFIPGVVMLYLVENSVNSSFIKPFTWWGNFDWMTILTTLSNWFSPIFFQGYNNANFYLTNLLSVDKIILLLSFLPVIFAAVLFGHGLLKDRFKTEKSFIFLIGLLLFLTFSVLSALDLYMLVPRYTILALPPLLLFLGYSLSRLKNVQATRIIVLVIVVGYSLCYTDSYLSTSLMDREYGVMYATSVLKDEGVTSKDSIFMGECGNFLGRYLKLNSNTVVPFSELDAFVRGHKRDLRLMMSDSLIDSLNQSNSKALLKNYILSQTVPDETKKMVDSRVDNLDTGRHFFVVVPVWVVNIYPYFASFSTVPNRYEEYSLYYSLMIKMYSNVLIALRQNPKMKFVSFKVNKYWGVFEYEKFKTKPHYINSP